MRKILFIYPLIITFLLILSSIAESNNQISFSGKYSIVWSKSFNSDIKTVNIKLDLTGDSISDVIVVLSNSSITEIQALRGNDGSLLWSKTFSATAKDNSIIILGDIDGDNIKDFILRIGSYMYALSGKNGNLEWQYISSSPIFEDFNGDGIIDLLVKQVNYIKVLDGRNRKEIFSKYVDTDYETYIVDDLDGDGGKDILIKEKYFQSYMKITAINGLGNTLWTEELKLNKADSWISLKNVSYGGDIDGDGKKDLVLSFKSYISDYPNSYYQCIVKAKKGNNGNNFWAESITSYWGCYLAGFLSVI
jgi:hypothetical protein